MGRHHPVRLGQLPSVQRLEFGLAVFVVVMATFAIARPGQAMAYTRGVDIVNASSVALRIESTTGFPYGISTPPAGATIDVGRRMHVEVTSQALDSNHGDVIFDIVGSSNRFFVHLSAQPFGGSVQASCTAQGGFACTPENPVIASQVTFLDAPGSVHNLPPDQRQAQANILKQLCANPDTGGLATCELKLISEVAVESPQHQVGGYVNNTTDFEQGTDVEKVDTVVESNSIELAVQAGTDLFKLIDASIKVSYNHEWSTEHDFKQKITVHIPPHNQCAVLGTAPMLRDTGDFTVKMGNSTWTLAGVYFDTPDPNRAADWGYTIVCKKLTASQLATLPHGVSSTPVVRGPYTVGAGATHGSIARTRLRLQLSGAARLIPGQLVRYRVLLGRRNPADRLVYSPQNVRVRLRHGTRTVGDAVISTLRVGHPRTLQVTVIVPRSAQDRFCVTATVTARRAIGTQARACGTVDTSLRGLG